MHFVILPLTLVSPPVTPSVDPLPMDVIVIELPDIHRVVSPLESTGPVLLPVLVISLIFSSIWPRLHSVAVLFVISPVATVSGTIHVYIYASPMSFII